MKTSYNLPAIEEYDKLLPVAKHIYDQTSHEYRWFKGLASIHAALPASQNPARECLMMVKMREI